MDEETLGSSPIDAPVCDTGADPTTEEGPHSHKPPSDESKPPIKLCQLIVNHPKKAFGITLGAQLSMTFLTFILLISGYDILPTDFTDVPLDLTDDVMFLRSEAWKRRDINADILPKTQQQVDADERSFVYEPFVLYYDLEGTDDNIFTKENLMHIKNAETLIEQTADFHKYCLSDGGDSCAPVASLMRFFDGTYKLLDPDLFDPTFDNIEKVLIAAQKNKVTNKILQYYLGRDSVIEESSVYNPITRSVFYLAQPLPGYQSIADRTEEQENTIKDYIMGPLRSSLKAVAGSEMGQIDFIYSSKTLYVNDLNRQVIYDLFLAGGSFTFIFCFMWFQTRSLFITTCAVGSILMGFTGANLIYRILFDFRYFGIFHVLSVFIILGIGADDVFVFYDTWRATDHLEYPSLAHRLSHCYRKATTAMFVTSLTTMIAFFASALSPLLAVSSFGLFSGLLVLVNYFSVITFLPCVVIVHHIYWQHHRLPCYCCFQNGGARVSAAHNDGVTKTTSQINLVHNQSTQDISVQGDTNIKKEYIIVKFFAGPFSDFITNKVIKWIVLLLYCALIVMFIYFATQLEPQEDSVRIFKDDTNHGKAKVKSINSFKAGDGDRVIKVYMIWGLDLQDRSVCHKTDFAGCLGDTVWDNSFDLNPSPAQMSLLKLCSELKSLPEDTRNRLKMRENIDGLPEIECFIETMNTFFKNEAVTMNQAASLQLPLKERNVKSLMVSRPDVYNAQQLPYTYYRYFETGLSYWLMNGYHSTDVGPDSSTFHDYLGEVPDQFDTSEITNKSYNGMYYGTRLRYAAIAVNTSLIYGNVGYQTGLPVMHEWEAFFEKEIEKMPPSLQGGFQTTTEETSSWHWFKVQKELEDSAMRGIALGLGLTLPILILATGNLVTGVLASITICCITVSVMGLIPLVGWKLGVLESLNLSMVVGLAVDYVIHLAEGYSTAPEATREQCVRTMLHHVGISVVSGAFTTLGASLFMMFAQILFFMRFSIFMLCTIGFSMLYALGFFTALLATVGPQNDFGAIRPWFLKIAYFMKNRRSTDSDCSKCNGKGYLPK